MWYETADQVWTLTLIRLHQAIRLVKSLEFGFLHAGDFAGSDIA